MMKKNPIFAMFLFFALPFFVNAASFDVNTNKEVVIIENEAVINISIENDAPDTMTALEGRVVFDSDNFELVNIATKNSIIDYWIVEPSLDDDGLFFNGALNGEQNGLLFSLKLKAINTGAFVVNVEDGKAIMQAGELYQLDDVLSNDLVVEVSDENYISEDDFRVISTTHPNENQWYNNNLVRFDWTLPNDAESVKLLIDENEFSWPSVDYTPPITNKEVELEDGIWYFHIRYKGADGWSDVETVKVMIDSEQPKEFNFDLTSFDELIFSSEDTGSGIQGFELYIPSKDYTLFTNAEKIEMPFLSPGEYSVKLKAIDKAGNYIEGDSVLFVPYLDSPAIDKLYSDGQKVVIRGTSYPQTKNIISLEGAEIYNDLALMDSDGSFVFEKSDITPGSYRVYITVVDDEIMSRKTLIGFVSIVDSQIINEYQAPYKVLLTVLLMVLALSIIYYLMRREEDKFSQKKKRGRPRKNKK